jgi:hypothetical protein
MFMAIALYAHGGWRKTRMIPIECPDGEECIEQAETMREPGGALSPAG